MREASVMHSRSPRMDWMEGATKLLTVPHA